MGGWLGARVRGLLGVESLAREMEATKLRVKLLEQDQDTLEERVETLERVHPLNKERYQ